MDLFMRLQDLATAVKFQVQQLKDRIGAVEAVQSTGQVSAADLAAGLATKENTIAAGSTSQYWRGDKTWQTLNSASVGLGNVNNTSDANKPISTAQQAALELKANLAGAVFTGAISATNLSGTNTGDQDLSAYVTTSAVAASYQPLDGDLTSIAGLTGTAGFAKKTAANTWTLDTSTYLTANQTITLSGDISGSGATAITTAIGANKVTRGMLAAASGAAILGATAAGNVGDLTGTQATALLNAFTSSLKGLAPASGGGTTNFLRADGTWSAPAGGGGTTTNAATFNNAGLGAASGTTFDGSVARTISYNSIGAQPLSTQLTNFAATAWGSGTQVPTLTAANTFTLKTVGSATGNILDKASGDALYRPITYVPAVTEITTVPTGSLLYRKTAGTGAAETQTLATLKTDLGLTGTNSGDQTITLTGDVTGTGTGSFATTIAAGAVALSKMANLAANSIIGNNTGSAATPLALTGPQVTAMLSAFGGANGSTGGALGAVPAPVATDNVKFLKGDGTWASPTASATAGGSSGNLQYNNATAIAGAANLNIDASGNLRVAYASATTNPAADNIAFVPQRLLASGGRVLPRFLDENGVFNTMQPHLGRNSVAWMQGTGNTTPTISAINMTAAGTATSRVPAATNKLTRSRRIAYVSAATAGAAGGLYSSSLNPYSVGSGSIAGGGGFFAVFRWGCSDASAVAGAHMFIGMKNDIATPSVTANPNAFTNCVGIAQLNGGTNLNIVFGGSTAQTSIDLGANFPAAGLSTDVYELILYAPATANNEVFYRVERLNTGDVASGTLTGTAGTALPSNSTFIGPRLYRSNNATALAVGIDILGFSVESEFV